MVSSSLLIFFFISFDFASFEICVAEDRSQVSSGVFEKNRGRRLSKKQVVTAFFEPSILQTIPLSSQRLLRFYVVRFCVATSASKFRGLLVWKTSNDILNTGCLMISVSSLEHECHEYLSFGNIFDFKSPVYVIELSHI